MGSFEEKKRMFYKSFKFFLLLMAIFFFFFFTFGSTVDFTLKRRRKRYSAVDKSALK